MSPRGRATRAPRIRHGRDLGEALAPLAMPVVRDPDGLSAEKRPLELAGLRGREPGLLEQIDDHVGDLQLFWRKRGRLWVPTQTSPNVRLDPRTRTCELVSELVQLTHLLEQRPKLRVVDRHDSDLRRDALGTSLEGAIARAPLMLTNKDAAKFGAARGRIVELLEEHLAGRLSASTLAAAS